MSPVSVGWMSWSSRLALPPLLLSLLLLLLSAATSSMLALR